MLSTFKQSFLNRVVGAVRASPFLEGVLQAGCAQPWLRRRLKFNAIAHHYLASFNHPEWRIARLDRVRFWVNIAEYQGLWLYFLGEHQEPRSAQLAAELIQAGDTCIDVGANMGSYTFLMAQWVGDRGRVFAFEPQPDLYQKLLASQQLNRFGYILTLDPRILSHESGTKCKLFLSSDPRNSGMASMLCQGDFLRENDFIEAETIRLSDYFQQQNIQICNFLKVDVECAEMAVFQGAIDLFQENRIHYLLVEQAAGSDSQKFLQSWGYSGWFIDETQPQLISSDRALPGIFGNFIFVSSPRLKDFQHRYAHWLES